MSDVKIIIELDKNLGSRQKKALLDFMHNELNISEKCVRVFKEKNYIYSSEYSQKIYETIRSEKTYEYL